MKASERLKEYLAGELVDHIPYNLISPEEALSEIYGYKTIDMYKKFDIYAEVIKRGKEDFGLESANIGLGLRTLGAAMGSTLYYPERGINRLEEQILHNYADWDKLIDADPYNNEILTPLLEKTAKVKERLPDINVGTRVTGPFSTAIAVRPVEKVLRDTKKNPEKLKELIELVVDNSLRWVEAFTKEFGKATVSIADPVTCTDILSHKQFMEFSFPEMKRLTSGIKEITGFKPSLHICGHTKGIWEDLRELEISSFSVDDCEDIGETREALGDLFTIVGNVPPVNILKNGSVDDVIQSVKDCIRKGATSPKGYILSSGCQIPIGTPKENLEAFVHAAKTYGKDARIGEIPLELDEG
ncbi:MAG TPA: uroporphyrinogen decarboxylase family protein [Tissierellaceae bacterium]|nr:uroporphyrinogen decarboxylase family protein [Tissierellaceae bacterium]